MELKDEQSLIERARAGDSAALNALSAAVGPRVRAYLLRVALDYTLAEDLTQETLLEMVKSVGQLRESAVFWPWLYRIAMSKFQTHFRREKLRHETEQVLHDRFSGRLAVEQGQEGLSRLLKTELSRNILSAIETLNPRDRAILSLRCFNELEYPDIAETLETSESNARILFYRAKKALKKELVRQGLKGSALVMALGFFGSLTETASAGTAAGSVTVSAASVNVSLSTAVAAACGAKVACAILAVAAATGVLATAGILHVVHSRPVALPPRETVTSFHFTAQSRNNTPDSAASLSKGAYEQWYYFPEGIEGPFFLRMQRWDPQRQQQQCAWIQNGEGNYYWHSGDNILYLNNYRLWSRSLTQIRVRRLPTDDAAMTAFLDRMEGSESGLEVRRDARTGLVAETVDHRFVDTGGFTSRYDYNTIDAATFENPWMGIPVADERDAMRRRGWTYFTVEGTVNGKPFSGRGRLPFFYAHCREHSAWLAIDLPDGGRLIDTPESAAVQNGTGVQRARYAGGRFFKGLGRPWMGLHTLDAVRRDAARQGIEFTTRQLSEFHKTGSEKDYYADTQVVCTIVVNGREATIEYLVDMQNDLLKTVDVQLFDAGGQPRQATLTFTYLQTLPPEGDFSRPMLDPAGLPELPDDGPRWLLDLADNGR